MEEEKQDGTAARPFQLRPSILSGFGSSFGSFGTSGDKTSKEFTLRPSALTSATSQLDSSLKSESKKRLQVGDGNTSDTSKANDEEPSKRTKIAAAENEKTESIKLTDDIVKPSGIGTFGFGQEEKSKVDKNNLEKGEENSLLQEGASDNKKSFVFGNNSNKETIGFNTIKSGKSDDDEESEVAVSNGQDESESVSKAGNEKLLENADEYRKMLNQRTQFKEVEQLTGEEDERNILQVLCKLHLFDKKRQNWVEKGRGTLKLNDRCQSEGIFQSRLVFRTQGTNIVLLNVMLWPTMCCERVKEKSIRITAIDPDSKEVKIYLITANVKECLQIFVAIERRIKALKRNKDNAAGNSGDNAIVGNCESTKSHTDEEDSSTESDRLSSRENSSYGATDNESSDQTSPSQTS